MNAGYVVTVLLVSLAMVLSALHGGGFQSGKRPLRAAFPACMCPPGQASCQRWPAVTFRAGLDGPMCLTPDDLDAFPDIRIELR